MFSGIFIVAKTSPYYKTAGSRLSIASGVRSGLPAEKICRPDRISAIVFPTEIGDNIT